MQAVIELDDDQIESILVEGLKKNYEIHLKTYEDNEHHVHEAFQIMLAYFMTDKEFRKYSHQLAKVQKKYLGAKKWFYLQKKKDNY